MKILGVDQSSNQNSIAVMQDDEVLVKNNWDGMTSRNQEFFPRVESMLSSISLRLEDIDLFAVGLGPGSFTGVRIALSAVNAMARPGPGEVIGIGSADALAEAVIRERGVSSVAVVGDARRERFWCAVFSSAGGLPVVQSECSLVAKDEIEKAVKDAELIVSPEWERVGDALSKAASGRCIEESRFPDAVSCARLALARVSLDFSGDDPVLPIYLHPAVVKKSSGQGVSHACRKK